MIHTKLYDMCEEISTYDNHEGYQQVKFRPVTLLCIMHIDTGISGEGGVLQTLFRREGEGGVAVIWEWGSGI